MPEMHIAILLRAEEVQTSLDLLDHKRRMIVALLLLLVFGARTPKCVVQVYLDVLARAVRAQTYLVKQRSSHRLKRAPRYSRISRIFVVSVDHDNKWSLVIETVTQR
jgi:hypothetical protein